VETTPPSRASGDAPPATRSGRVLERMLLVVLVPVVGLAVTAAITFVWGIAKTYDFAKLLVDEGADSELAVVEVLEIIDVFLLAIVVLILAVGLFELFIADLPAPDWLVVKDLSALKSKVSDVIVLLLGIKFLEKAITTEHPEDLVWYAIAFTLVGGLLIVFRTVKPMK
jgi:uncharacterized membrane protein YqhA